MLNSNQVKALQSISELNLENKNPYNEIESISLLLNILASLKALQKAGVKLPLSMHEKEDLLNQLHGLGHDYYFDLKGRAGYFYDNLSQYRENKFLSNELLAGKNRYTLIQPIRYFTEKSTRDFNNYAPKIKVVQYDKDDHMVKMLVRFYYFAINKDGFDEDNCGFFDYTFWATDDSVGIFLAGILRDYQNDPYITRALNKLIDKSHRNSRFKKLTHRPSPYEVIDSLDLLVGGVFNLINIKLCECLESLLNASFSTVVPARAFEKHDANYYDSCADIFNNDGVHLKKLPTDTNLLFYVPFASQEFLAMFENDAMFSNLTKLDDSSIMCLQDTDHHLNLMFANFKSDDSYSFSNLLSGVQFVLSDLTKTEYEIVRAIMTVLQIDNVYYSKILLNECNARDIFRLIYLQQEQLDYTVDEETQITADTRLKKLKQDSSSAFLTFLEHFGIGNDALDDADVTVNELDDYLNDLLNRRPIDSEIFNLIAGVGENAVNDREFIALEQAKALGINKKLSTISYDEKMALERSFPRHIKKRITNVFRIDDDTDLSNYEHIEKGLVHGTKSSSVFSILKLGLLDAGTLARMHNQHYDYTGSGLGNGIYFACASQSDKSVNYAASEKSYAPVYLFICDVGYDDVVKTYSYGDIRVHGKQNLIVGKHVGSYNRDEIVAKSGKQVKMRYLVEFDKYHR